jgi:hypothetical protein
MAYGTNVTDGRTFASMNKVSTPLDLTRIRIVNKSKHPLPSYATEHSAGMDLRADRYF